MLGYLSLFSVIWPLTACSFLVNNWVEARGDAMKIAISSQRPIPWRADSIGPWLSSLGFMSWLGSLTSAALVYLFSSDATNHYEPDGSPHRITAWALLLCLLLAEHVYLLLQFVVRGLMAKVDSPGLQRERAQRFAMRKQFLEQTFGNDVLATGRGEISVVGGLKVVQQEEKMTREALEEEARRLANMPVEER